MNRHQLKAVVCAVIDNLDDAAGNVTIEIDGTTVILVPTDRLTERLAPASGPRPAAPAKPVRKTPRPKRPSELRRPSEGSKANGAAAVAS